MKVFENPDISKWRSICERPTNNNIVRDDAKKIFDTVRDQGDQALIAYTKHWSGAELDTRSLLLHVNSIEVEARGVDPLLRAAIDDAYDNIYTFHVAQTAHDDSPVITTAPGVSCWRKPVPIQRVGLYVPGGTAPLFSTALMLGIPAKIAGCTSIIVASPPNANGDVHPGIRYIAAKIGIPDILLAGGAEAIAALACGTETVERVDKICGPGNQYVTAGKELALKHGTAIDMPAGPSEVMVIADSDTNSAYAAADLLSQAEHGADSQVALVADNLETVNAITAEVEKQVSILPRQKIARAALAHSFAVTFSTQADMIAFANTYAPEHLILSLTDADKLACGVKNAGSVFIGAFTPESAGDYASGTNHTLPTDSWARSYGGVSVDTFRKYITYQSITAAGLQQLGNTIITMANAEGLDGHANAVRIRL